MKRKLLKQISTEWRSNLWLGIELLIVSTILFFIFDGTSTILRIKNTYIGVDINNVYRLTIGWKTKSSPTFETPLPQAGETEDDAWTRYNRDNYNLRMQQIRKLPGVISAASGSTSPYNYNFNGNPVKITGNAPDSLKNQENYVNTYSVAPDYPKVFNIRGINGETPEELSRMLDEGKVLLTSNAVNTAKAGLTPKDLVNMTARFTPDDEGETYVIGAVIEPIRRADYEAAFAGTVLMRDDFFRNVYVRVKEGYDEQFLSALTATDSPLNQGNCYIVEAKSFKNIRNDLHRNDDAQLRNMIICMGFLLLTVFLGLLGTFWFRTQQRVREIAMRKVSGAGNGQIFRRLMGEGLLILVIATVPAWGLDALLVHYDILMFGQIMADNVWVTSLIEAAVIFLFMALMIVAGVYFPAMKAMKVEPAEVLRGE